MQLIICFICEVQLQKCEICTVSSRLLVGVFSQHGRIAEAEDEFERLLGEQDVKSALEELSRSNKGDETEGVKLSELLCGRHSKGAFPS